MFFSHLNRSQKQKVVHAIQAAERGSSGEIRVHVSYAKNEEAILPAAEAKFKELSMHQTELRNGVLLYVNPRMKKFALYGDQGIHERVKQDFWDQLAKSVSTAIQEKNMVHGIEQAVHAIGQALKEHFPSSSNDKNELSDEMTESH